MRRHPVVLLVTVASVSVPAACGGADDEAAVPTSDTAATSTVPTDEIGILEANDLVYLEDEAGTWTLDVTYPDGEGPWPLIVVIPPQIASSAVAPNLAERGAVVVHGDAWVPTAAWRTDPDTHLYGGMDRAACIVSWAQAHADEYGADPEVTTVAGYSGGAMAATWVALGLADDSACDDPISYQPVALVPGESQFLFHHERWDPAFESGDPEPRATVAGLLDPGRWDVSPDLRVGLWSATHPIGETRAIENPPADDSWIWLRDAATPVVDDLAAVGAFDDARIDWRDNALLMEQRMRSAGIDVRNEVYDIGHDYADEVYDLILAVQPGA